jgi:hypothetical protein
MKARATIKNEERKPRSLKGEPVWRPLSQAGASSVILLRLHFIP